MKLINLNCITTSCNWNTYVTWRGNEYELSEDDTRVSKHVGSVIIYKSIVIVLLLVILQNNKKMHGTYIKNNPQKSSCVTYAVRNWKNKIWPDFSHELTRTSCVETTSARPSVHLSPIIGNWDALWSCHKIRYMCGSVRSTDDQGLCIVAVISVAVTLFENLTKFYSYFPYFLIALREIRCESCVGHWWVPWTLVSSYFIMAVNCITFEHVQWNLMVRNVRFRHCFCKTFALLGRYAA